jgi:hypothetical protein
MRARAAEVVGTLEADRTHYGNNGLEAQILVVGSLTTTTGDHPLFGRTLTEKAGENGRTDTMHTFANQRLNRFHINLSGPTAVSEGLAVKWLISRKASCWIASRGFFPERAVGLVRLAAIGRSGR